MSLSEYKLPVLDQHGGGAPAGVLDPVCGMTVNPATAAGSVDHDGQTYYFCSRHCVEKFRDDPARFLNRPGSEGHGAPTAHAAETLPASSEGTTYTCPMHPEVVRPGPGSCPICGMALEPINVSTDEEADPELDDMSRRFRVCLVLTMPLLVLSMATMVPGWSLPQFLSGRFLVWIEFVLAAPVVLWGGRPFFERGAASLVSRNLNMFTLISLGTGAAFAFSALAALFPDIFPDSFRHDHGEVPVYFEPSAVIVTLVLMGQVLELRARRQTGSAIRAICASRPRQRTGSAMRVRKKKFWLSTWFRAIGCEFFPATRYPSTAAYWKGGRGSTRRWSQASRFPSKSRRATA